MKFIRAQTEVLASRLREPVTRIQIVAGPRQIGKSTLVRQTLAKWPQDRLTMLSADTGTGAALNLNGGTEAYRPERKRDASWLIDEWKKASGTAKATEKRDLRSGTYQRQAESARRLPPGANLTQGQQPTKPHVLVIDEIQKIPQWSETVKALWDVDRAEDIDMHVILLGSAPLLMQKGLAESLAGRYELIRMSHWSLAEMQEAFDFSVEEFIYFGGYPGAAQYIKDEVRWRNYVVDSLITPNIEKDILQMARVEKPALLKLLFELGCQYSGETRSLSKLKGQLEDAGNVTTLADYLHLLSEAGLLSGLQKFAADKVRQRNSVPKLNARNTGLMSVYSGYSFAEAQADRAFWGHLVETSVGAHLINTAEGELHVSYWRESPYEVDFVLAQGKRITAIEVKSGRSSGAAQGIKQFQTRFPNANSFVVGASAGCDITVAELLSKSASHWLAK
jgi:predicted AAA+ superfamily ATPase